jgi:hypothetical protein
MLFMKAELENVASVHLLEDQNLCISVRNPLNDYEVREKVVFHPHEFVEQHDNSSTDRAPPCHFQLTWEGAKKPSTLTCLSPSECQTAFKKNKNVKTLPREYTSEDSNASAWIPILAVSCRGLEPYEFHPMGQEFKIVSEAGTEYMEDVDLSEDDWADYDEANDQPVAVNGVEFKWQVAQ